MTGRNDAGSPPTPAHGPDGLPAAIRAEEASRLVSAGPAPTARAQVAAALGWIGSSLRRCAGAAAAWEQPGRWSYANESRTEQSAGGQRERPDEPAGRKQPRQGTGSGRPAPSSR